MSQQHSGPDALSEWFRKHRPADGWGASAQAWMDLQELLARAWDEGEAAGAEYESRRNSPDPDDWDGLELPLNPHRHQASAPTP
jgi:hypothetical protein